MSALVLSGMEVESFFDGKNRLNRWANTINNRLGIKTNNNHQNTSGKQKAEFSAIDIGESFWNLIIFSCIAP